MGNEMTPGEIAYNRAFHGNPPRTWQELSDADRQTWEHGASLPSVTGQLNVTLPDDKLKSK